MVTPFQLTDNDAMYILPATAIEMPLFVVRDFGAESRRHYLHCLPRTKWPGLFTLKIKKLMAQGKKRGKKRSRCMDNSDNKDESDDDNFTLTQMKKKAKNRNQ